MSEISLEPILPSCYRNITMARLIASGMVKTFEIGRSAAKLLRASHAYGEGSETKWQWAVPGTA
jgi:hypothetical protein